MHRTLGRSILVVSLILLGWAGIAHLSARSAPGSSPGFPGTPALTPRSGISAPINVYTARMSTHLGPAVAGIPERVYVPNSLARTVDVIDPATFEIVGHFPVGRAPNHITPSWDMTRLYVDNTQSNSLTAIDPRTGTPDATIAVMDPYNLYFTLDGNRAVVVAERFWRLDFRDPQTWRLIQSISIPWPGVDHLDFSADGRYLITSSEFSGMLTKVDTVAMAVVGEVQVGGLPVDVRLSPDATVFYVANQGRHGVSVIDPVAMKEVEFIPTGRGAHGLEVSRDAKFLYVSNRLEGTISVIDFASRRVQATWDVGGSPDMMQVSPDGRQLWVSNRFGNTVSVIDTESGQVVRTITVGASPHGLAYFPQPGRFSLGHNGVYR